MDTFRDLQEESRTRGREVCGKGFGRGEGGSGPSVLHLVWEALGFSRVLRVGSRILARL